MVPTVSTPSMSFEMHETRFRAKLAMTNTWCGDGLVRGRYLQVVFVIKLPEDLEFESLSMLDWTAFIDSGAAAAIYVCHAMPMSARQISQYRKLWSNS